MHTERDTPKATCTYSTCQMVDLLAETLDGLSVHADAPNRYGDGYRAALGDVASALGLQSVSHG